jgi:hypothetical protein
MVYVTRKYQKLKYGEECPNLQELCGATPVLNKIQLGKVKSDGRSCQNTPEAQQFPDTQS